MNRTAVIAELSAVRDITPSVKHGRYPAYASSGSPWLRDLPSHWKARRLKFVARSQPSNVDKKSAEGEVSVRLCNYVDVYKNDYITQNLDFMQATAEPAELAKFRLRLGDVLITKDSEEWNDIAVPAFVTQDFEDVACGYHLSQVRPRVNAMDGEYLFRAFRASGVAEQFQVRANGVTRFGLAAGAIGDVTFPVPPIEEQRSIAAFLRHETSRIDALIDKKQRLIELLAEKRIALIGHVVTKGLSTNVRMVNAGVPWLGDVPCHWQVKRLKFAVTFQRGHDLPTSERTEGEVPVVTSAGPSGLHDKAAARGPGIVTGRYGTIGTFHLIEGSYWPLNTTLYSIDLHDNQPRFLWYMLHVLKDVFLVNSAKSAVPGVDRNDLHEVLVVIPPDDEQNDIVRYLDDKVRGFEQLTLRVESAIDRLREYRSALISAAVTGKIDVRQEVHHHA